MNDGNDPAQAFLALHRPGEPLLLPNAWDRGSARLFASMGFRALATTSSGYAGSHGLFDGSITRDESVAHAGDLAQATPLPVTADLEDGFAPDAAGVAETVQRAVAAGIAGCSIEDYTGEGGGRFYPKEEAVERVAAAAEAAHGGERSFVLTARAENHLRGRDDLADTIDRLQRYQSAGADVLYAPGLSDRTEIETLVRAVDAPVNVLLRAGGPNVAELAAAGVARISVGGAFHLVSLGAVEAAAREFLEQGTHGFTRDAAAAVSIRGRAFKKA